MWGEDWNGCKLWGSCGGQRCSGGGSWRSPVKYPTKRPPGVHPERSRVDRCPLHEVKPSTWRLLNVWNAWKQLGGMPGVGAVEDQEAKLIEAFSVLDSESDMIQAHARELEQRRASSRRR